MLLSFVLEFAFCSWCSCIAYLLYHPNQISRTDWGGRFTHEPQTWELTLAINYFLFSVFNFTICCVWCNFLCHFPSHFYPCFHVFSHSLLIHASMLCFHWLLSTSCFGISLEMNSSFCYLLLIFYSLTIAIPLRMSCHNSNLHRTFFQVNFDRAHWGLRITHEPQTWELTLAINLFSFLSFKLYILLCLTKSVFTYRLLCLPFHILLTCCCISCFGLNSSFSIFCVGICIYSWS